MIEENQVLPLAFKYESTTRVLDVTWADGSIVRYFDIDPRSAFLSPANARRNRDFINFLETRIEQRNPVQSETIQEATIKLTKPQTRPALVEQQSGVPQTKLSFPLWGVGTKT